MQIVDRVRVDGAGKPVLPLSTIALIGSKATNNNMIISPYLRATASLPCTLKRYALNPLPCSTHRDIAQWSSFSKMKVKVKVKVKVVAMAKGASDEPGNGVLEKAAIGAGMVSTPVIVWSLYALKTTGCGLPPGPGGSIGALEGVSYLVVLGIVGWSLYTKAKTGSGLPNGPFGLLGAVEGLSYLCLLAILLVFGFQFVQNGSLPGPLPGEECFG